MGRMGAELRCRHLAPRVYPQDCRRNAATDHPSESRPQLSAARSSQARILSAQHGREKIPLDEPSGPVRICKGLLAAARRFAALVALNKNHRGNGHKSRDNEAKRLEIVTQPPKDKHVADGHGDGGQDDNEKRTVHR